MQAELAVVSPTAAALSTPRQRGSPPRGALPAEAAAVAAAPALRVTPGSSLDSDAAQSGTALLGSSQPQLAGWSVEAPAEEGSTEARGGQAAAAGGQPPAGPAATRPEGVAALAWASEQLAGHVPGWQEVLVSEADIKFLTAPDGRRITLGAGATGQV